MDPQDTDFTREQNVPSNHRPKRRGRTWIIIALVAVVVVAAAFVVALLTGGPTGDEARAQEACEEFVSEALTNPDSAEYSHNDTKYAGGNWTVRGTVDAANSFGSVLTSQYRCVVDSDTWELVLLRIDEEE